MIDDNDNNPETYKSALNDYLQEGMDGLNENQRSILQKKDAADAESHYGFHIPNQVLQDPEALKRYLQDVEENWEAHRIWVRCFSRGCVGENCVKCGRCTQNCECIIQGRVKDGV